MSTIKPKNYKYCIVPGCTSTTIKTPNKYFFDVPRQQKLRKKWCQIVRRDDKVPLSFKSVQHCCEDHFDLETDVENYIRCRLVGGNMKLKSGVLPHKFDCQQTLTHTKHNNKPRSANKKHQKMELVEASTSSQQQSVEFVSCKEESDSLFTSEVDGGNLPKDEESQVSQFVKKVGKKRMKITCEKPICNSQEAVARIGENGDSATDSKLVLKKWTQIRDSWCKDVKKRRDLTKSGSSASFYKPYKYSDQLSFLRKVTDTGEESEETNEGGGEIVNHTERRVGNVTSSEIENIRRDSINERSTDISSKGSAHLNTLKRKKNEVYDKMIQYLDSKEKKENPQLHFFKSILPITSTFSIDETLQFQAGVINLIQSIKRQRLGNPYQNSGSTTHHENTGCSSLLDNSLYHLQPPSSNLQSPASSGEHAEGM